MSKTRGTPKTMNEAICNAITDINERGMDMESKEARDLIMFHVQDFLAQHFTISILKNSDDLKGLYKTITRSAA